MKIPEFYQKSIHEIEKQSILLILISLCLSVSASPIKERETILDGYKFHLNGISIHFDKSENQNFKNWGIGLEKIMDPDKLFISLGNDWETFWELDVYEDSYSDIGLSVGIGAKRAIYSHLDAGFKAGIVFEEGLEDDANTPVLPFVLPFAETNFNHPINLRGTLVPPLPMLDLGGLISLQLIIDP